MFRICFTVLLLLPTGSRPTAAEEPRPPSDNPAVAANNAFACDLYQQLAKSAKADENLFFSPYSISSALMMTAEGASGQTALEIGRVLNFPATAQQADTRNPWKISLLHAGIAALNTRLQETDAAVVSAIEQRKAELQSRLTVLREEIGVLQRQKKYREAQQLTVRDRALVKELNAEHAKVRHYEVRIANALWGHKTLPLRDEFVNEVSGRYGTGGFFPVDFRNNPEGSRSRINTWTERQTKNRIRDLLPAGSVTPLTRLILTNAIYFRGDWKQPFRKKQTQEADFYLTDGSVRKVRLMSQRSHKAAGYAAFNADGTFFDSPQQIERGQTDGLYPDAGGFAIVELPYEGDALSMVLVAPISRDGLPQVEAKLSADNLQRWLQNLEKRTTHVDIPKCRLETTYSLGSGGKSPSGVLPALGMIRAFQDPAFGAGAEFDRMVSSTDPNHALYIGSVIHKAFLDVDEKGTEAAAATAVIMMAPTSAVPVDLVDFIPTFRADRPYLCLIRERETGAVLFLGRVSHPEGESGA